MTTPVTAVTPTAPARHLPLAGTYNVRDVGGYATQDGGVVRWRALFRADSLHRLDEAGQSHLLDAGVTTIIDLRRDEELATAPNVFAASDRVRYLQVSLSPTPIAPNAQGEFDADSLPRTYRAIVDGRHAELRQILGTLAAPGAFPALVHCTAGKDRTGVVVALLLGLAGVDHATIAEDYALTSTYLTEDGFIADARARAAAAGRHWILNQHLLGCPAEMMLDVLAYIDERFGGVEAFLRQIGLTDAELQALRTALLAER